MIVSELEIAQKKSPFIHGMTIVLTLVGLAYPFVVYFGWEKISPRILTGFLLTLYGLRFWLAHLSLSPLHWKDLISPWIIPALLIGLVFIVGRHHLLLYVPTLISAALLLSFGQTLQTPSTMVERFARLKIPFLSEEQKIYCRRVTIIWCLFFILNGLVSLGLALRGYLIQWTLYTGVISYLLIGTLFGVEYVYRHWRFRPPGALLSRWMSRWNHPNFSL